MERCFFLCTAPGCHELAEDLHHCTLHSEGGSDSADNLVGLCKRHHVSVHASPDGVAEAKRWLAEQIEACPVRIYEDSRLALFEEIRAATRSVDRMVYYRSSIHLSSTWSNYEVFLKGALRFLREEGAAQTPTAAVVHHNLLGLYRRRGRKGARQAATRHLRATLMLCGRHPHVPALQAIRARALYEAAYMAFCEDERADSTGRAFLKAALAAEAAGDSIGAVITEGVGSIVDLLRGTLPSDGIHRVEDRVRAAGALDYADRNIAPMYTYQALAAHAWENAAELAQRAVRNDRPTSYVGSSTDHHNYGVALLGLGDLDGAIAELDRSRRLHYASHNPESFSPCVVSLGDALWLSGLPTDAEKRYREAIRHGKPHMNNAAAIAVATNRLAALQFDPDSPPKTFFHRWQHVGQQQMG